MTAEAEMAHTARRMNTAAGSFNPSARSVGDIRIDLLKAPYLAASGLARLQGFADTRDTVQTMQAMLSGVLRAATLWWCSADVVRLAETASKSLPPQKLEQTDPPSTAGLIVFETPLRDTDSDGTGTEIYTNAILWYPAYVMSSSRFVASMTSLSWAGPPWGWWVLGHEHWGEGETQHDGAVESDIADRARMATLWSIIQQKRIAPETTVSPDRAGRRRVSRAGLPPDAGDVRVLDVRRPSGHGPAAGSTVDYSHRWIVSAHWRNQWLPSTKSHRQQLILPYVKGPEDKPLVVRDDVHIVR